MLLHLSASYKIRGAKSGAPKQIMSNRLNEPVMFTNDGTQPQTNMETSTNVRVDYPDLLERYYQNTCGELLTLLDISMGGLDDGKTL